MGKQTRGQDRRRAAVVSRRVRALELRLQGYSLRGIAKEMSLGGPESARKLIDGAFKDIESPIVDELRKEINERSRLLLEQLMPVVMNKRAKREDRLDAIDRVIKIDRELRHMHGVDEPKRTEITGKDGGPLTFDLSKLTDDQLNKIIAGDTNALARGGEEDAGGPSEGGAAAPGVRAPLEE